MNEIDEFVKSLAGASPRTVSEYATDLRLFAEWFTQTRGEEFTVSAITPTDVRDYRAYLLHTKRQAPATINRRLTVLRVFFRWALRQGLMASDLMLGIELDRRPLSSPRWLDSREQSALLRAAETKGDARDLAILTLMLNAGLRLGEVEQLTLDDVEISKHKGQVRVHEGEDRERIVPLNAEARRALRAYLAVRPQVSHRALFVGQHREPLGRLGIGYRIAALARRAGLERVTPRTLRHTFAKNLVDQGVSLDQVATLLGHRSLTTTTRYIAPRLRARGG